MVNRIEAAARTTACANTSKDDVEHVKRTIFQTEKQDAVIEAQLALVVIYSEGHGVEIDRGEAGRWLVRAAEAGEAEPDHAVVEEAPWWREPAHLDMLAGFLRYLVAGIMIALSYRLIVRPGMKKHLIEATPETTPAVAEGGALNKIEGGVGDDTTDPAASIPFNRVDRSASYAEQLRELQRLGGEDPKMMAMIVRNWMKHDSN